MNRLRELFPGKFCSVSYAHVPYRFNTLKDAETFFADVEAGRPVSITPVLPWKDGGFTKEYIDAPFELVQVIVSEKPNEHE